MTARIALFGVLVMAMLLWPKFALWFVACCVVLFVVFAGVCIWKGK